METFIIPVSKCHRGYGSKVIGDKEAPDDVKYSAHNRLPSTTVLYCTVQHSSVTRSRCPGSGFVESRESTRRWLSEEKEGRQTLGSSLTKVSLRTRFCTDCPDRKEGKRLEGEEGRSNIRKLSIRTQSNRSRYCNGCNSSAAAVWMSVSPR